LDTGWSKEAAGDCWWNFHHVIAGTGGFIHVVVLVRIGAIGIEPIDGRHFDR